MKRIIEGATYNTDTAIAVAEGTWEDEDRGIVIETTLYQNRAGVFFAIEAVHQTYRDRNGEIQTRVSYEWNVVGDHDKARTYCEEESLTILRDIGEMPPEAEAGEPATTLYVRIPPALKRGVDEAAGAAKLSVNAWATQCIERCLAGK